VEYIWIWVNAGLFMVYMGLVSLLIDRMDDIMNMDQRSEG
jgi:hypothetical protein